MSKIDHVDRTLLRLLQKDGRTSINLLASEVSLSETPCWRRIKRLENDGYMLGYKARIDQRKVGYSVVVFVLLAVNLHSAEATREFERSILACPQVLAFHNVSGEYDFLLQVVAHSLDDYSRFIEKEIRSIPCVMDICSAFSLRDIGGEIDLPV